MSSTFDKLMGKVNAKKDRRRTSDRAIARVVGKHVYDLDSNARRFEKSDDNEEAK